MAEAVPIIFNVKLFTLLEFILEGGKLGDVTEGCLLDRGVDLLDSLLGVVNLCRSLLGLHVSISLEM